MAEEVGGVEEGIKTLSSGSEFVFDFYCELCRDDGKNEEAEGYCVDCSEYLCGLCYSSHRRTRLSRHHELLEKDQMPKDTPLSADRISRDVSTKCNLHPGEIVKFFCKTHEALACSLCFVEGHKSCSDIESILKNSEGIFDSKEYAGFMQTLKNLHQQTRAAIKTAKSNVTRTESCFSEILQEVKLLRTELTVILDKLEQDVIAEVKTLESEEEQKMISMSNKCSTLAETIETIQAEIKSLQSSRRACQLYIFMKESGDLIRTMKNDILAAEDGLVMRTFRFEASRKLKDFIGSLNALGNISCEVQETPKTKEVQIIKPVLMKATHVSDINVRSNTDSCNCYITGSAMVPNSRLIIADSNNYKIKLLDTKTNQLISELKISTRSWDVTVISRNQAAVTLPGSKKILLLSVSDTLTLDREITVDGQCYGVAYSENRLIVTCINPAKLEIMDLSGNVMKKIQHDRNGKQLFQVPYYVCVSNDGDTLFVSDYSSGTVTSLTLDGVIRSEYSDRGLCGPLKMCVDQQDNVYVCGRDSINVHMLTADLTKIKIILTQADGLGSNLYSVSHCQETNRLYLGMWGNKMLKVYQIT